MKNSIRFHAPFDVMHAMHLLYSAAPRQDLKPRLVWKKQLSLADVAGIVKTSRHNFHRLLVTSKDGHEAVA